MRKSREIAVCVLGSSALLFAAPAQAQEAKSTGPSRAVEIDLVVPAGEPPIEVVPAGVGGTLTDREATGVAIDAQALLAPPTNVIPQGTAGGLASQDAVGTGTQ